MAEPRLICIGGSPSSGTTLLADIMDAAPGVACGPELNIFCVAEAYQYTEDFRAEAADRRAFATGACYAPRSRFFNTRHLGSVGLTEDRLRTMILEAPSLGGFVEAFTTHFAAFRHRDIAALAEKTPVNVNHAARFLEHFPDALFIHLVRDGRAVTASLLRRRYCLWEAAMIWAAQTYVGLEVDGHPNVATLRYEDLLEQPFETVARLLQRTGIGADPAVIEERYRHNRYRAGLQRPADWSNAGQSANVIRTPADYRSQLSQQQIEFLECASLRMEGRPESTIGLAGILQRLGYSLDGEPASVEPETVLQEHQRYAHRVTRPAAQRDLHLYLAATFFDPDGRRQRVNRRLRERTIGAREEWIRKGPPEAVTQWFALPRAVAAADGRVPASRLAQLRALMRQYGIILPERPGPISPDRLALHEVALQRARECYAARSYLTRPLRNDASAGEDWARSPLKVAPGLIRTYFYLYRRKLEAGRTVPREDLLTLLLACQAAQRSDDLKQQADELSGLALAAASKDEGLRSLLPEIQAGRWPRHPVITRHVRYVHDLVFRSAQRLRAPAHTHPVRRSLVELLATKKVPVLQERLADLLANHFDPEASLLMQPAAGAPIGAPSLRPMISALVPLAVIAASQRLDLPLRIVEDRIPRPAPLDPAGAPAGWESKQVLKHVAQLQRPPALRHPLSPVCPDGYLAALESELVRAAAVGQIDRQGWLLYLPKTPPDAPYVASLRYDVDRPLTHDQVRQILLLDRRLGCHSSVYVRPETFDAEHVRCLLNAGCEIGFHASGRSANADAFLERLTELVGRRVGITFHGGVGSEYWLGRKTLLHCARRSAAYVEMLHEWSPHPALYRASGFELMTTPMSVKVDAYPDWVPRQMALIRRYCGHAIFEQHPDHISDAWCEMMLRCRDEGACFRTVAEHVGICRGIECASVEADVIDGRLRLALDCEAPAATMLRVNRSLFQPPDSFLRLRQPGAAGLPGLWHLIPASEQTRCIEIQFRPP